MSAIDEQEADATGVAEQQRQEPDAHLSEGALWDSFLNDYNRAFSEWNEKIDRLEKIYADEAMLKRDSNDTEMKIFWANMEVLNPSVYSRAPKPVVAAKFKSRKPVVQRGSEVLERCLATSFEDDDVHHTLKMVRDDFTLTARGTPWVRYEEKDGYQCVRVEHLSRRDFAHGPARKWKEVPWCGRRAFLTKQEMQARFEQYSGDLYKSAQYTNKGTGEKEEEDRTVEKKCVVWEFWHKTLGVVCWHSPGLDRVLDITNEPPSNLKGFFPCPRPAYGTLVRGTLKPIPDMVFYADQLEEINSLTNRISALSEVVKLRGFYSAGNDELKTAIEAALARVDDNAVLIPVSNVQHLGGGLAEALVWMPLDQVTNALQALVLMRQQLIQDVYEITGISDIMRGATDPNETLGAQQLKSQYGSIRVREKQEELVRIARDLARISGEIIAEQFSVESIARLAQYDEAPPKAQIEQQVTQIKSQIAQLASNPEMIAAAQANPEQAKQILGQAQAAVQKLQSTITIDQIVEMLRNENIRPFVLDIETDSTIMPDENAAKQRATEFLGALGTALAQLIPMVQGQPQSADFAGEVIKFAVAPFRAGRALDQAVDDFVDKMKQTASQPQPNPEQQKAEMEMKAKEAEAAQKAADREADRAAAAQDREAERIAKADEMARAQQKHDLEMEKLREERANAQIDREFAREDRELQREIVSEKRGFDQENHQRNMETRKGEISMKRAESGLPTEEVEQMQAEATIQTLQQTVEVMAQMAQAIMQGQQAIAASLDQLAEAQMASKQIVFDRNGTPVGIEAVRN
jgi:hypothetical protein